MFLKLLVMHTPRLKTFYLSKTSMMSCDCDGMAVLECWKYYRKITYCNGEKALKLKKTR